MTKIIDGKLLANQIRNEVATAVQAINLKGDAVNFAAVLVGDDPSSKIYVRNKQRACEQVGINFTLHTLPATCQQQEIIDLLARLSKDSQVHGILLQLPLPSTVVGRDETQAINMIAPEKDVDGLVTTNAGKLACGYGTLLPCTAQGVLYAIKSVCPDLTGKHVVMVGRSRIVGRPTALLLLQQNATVTICHRHTLDLKKYTQAADILVVAVGKPNLITADMVKKDAIVIDVGINRLPDGKLVGDVAYETVAPQVAAITPVPGGIGPLTIAFLMQNILTAYHLQNRS